MAYLAVCGHTNLDVILELKALPQAGESEPVLRRRVVWGGTGANIARHAAGLGVPVRLWSRVGEDFPPDWRACLEDDGVDLAHLAVVEDALTPVCTILTDAQQEQAFCMDEGPMAQMADHPPPAEMLEGLEGWLHVGTGHPAGYDAIVDAARRADVPVAFDPSQEMRFQYDARAFERMLDRSDVFFANRHETDLALRFLRYGDPEQLLDHVDTVVVTRGAEGASLHRSGRRPVHIPAFPAQVVDPTGAGDALRAGWYAGLRAGQDMAGALRWGQAAAAVAVGHPGPQSHIVRPADLGALVETAQT